MILICEVVCSVGPYGKAGNSDFLAFWLGTCCVDCHPARLGARRHGFTSLELDRNPIRGLDPATLAAINAALGAFSPVRDARHRTVRGPRRRPCLEVPRRSPRGMETHGASWGCCPASVGSESSDS